MADFLGLMKQATELKSKMEKLQSELDQVEVEGTAGGGAVVVKATGTGKLLEVKIQKEAIDPDDPETLEDLVLAGVNEALRNAQDLAQSKLGGVAGDLKGLGLPGL